MACGIVLQILVAEIYTKQKCLVCREFQITPELTINKDIDILKTYLIV